MRNHTGMAQKLSATARRDKAARDKAYAMSPDRKAKKAHAEREARANPSAAKGKDYDHKDNKFKTVTTSKRHSCFSVNGCPTFCWKRKIN